MSMLQTLASHYWTIAPVLRHRARPRPAPTSEAWSTQLSDPKLGAVTLRGLFRDQPASDAAVVVVHGLGGTTGTHYCVTAAHAAERAGVACLRLALRGADRDGEDLYHAGIADDLHAALASPALARFSRIYVLGFSLGGHVTLRYALAEHSRARDRRVRAVATICAPLDLELGARHIDSPAAAIYRRHVLSGLKEMYVVYARKRGMSPLTDELRTLQSIRRWDELAVVPRHGFGSVEEYYAQMSVGPHLGSLELPALVLTHPHDPMVPPWTYREHLEKAPALLTHRQLASGGHVGYPADLDLGEPGARGVEAQALTWLLRH